MTARVMGYDEACRALSSARRFGIHPSLAGMRELMRELGHPERAYQVVQVTGTNGKGSTVRFLHSILRAHGVRVGSFTSPHLIEYTEHVVLGGAAVSRELFAAGVAAALAAAERARPRLAQDLTEFELLTASALWILREAGVEWAVLEVGMGGRWDSTSVSRPSVSVVTNVGLDHAEQLGPTPLAIARDKAFVIKRGSHAILGPGTSTVDAPFARRAARFGVPVTRVRSCKGAGAPEAGAACYGMVEQVGEVGGQTRFDYRDTDVALPELALSGPAYQVENAACAIAAAKAALGSSAFDAKATRSAIAETRHPARFQVLRADPPLIVDGAHNPDGARALAEALGGLCGVAPITFVLGMLSDKRHAEFVRILAPLAGEFVVSAPDSPRATSAEELAGVARREFGGPVTVVGSVAEALESAVGSSATVVATGSLTTAAEALVWWDCGRGR